MGLEFDAGEIDRAHRVRRKRQDGSRATNHSEVQELRVLGAKKAALEGMVSQFTKTLLLLTENFYRSQEMSIKILRCGRSTVKYFSMLMDVFGHTSRRKIKHSYRSTCMPAK